MKRNVVITGVGVILPNCDNVNTLWRHLRSGSSQLSFMANPADPTDIVPAGRIRDFNPAKYLADVPERYYTVYSRHIQYYLSSLFLACDHARLAVSDVAADRIAIYDGSSRGPSQHRHQQILMEAGHRASDIYSRLDLLNGLNGQTVGIAAALLRITGPTMSFSGTCCSGSIAIGQGFRDICDDRVDVAFVTGHDSALTPDLYAAYGEAGLLSRECSSVEQANYPYGGEQPSLVFGEGSVTLVLEERTAALKRNANVLAEIRAYESGNEGRNPYRAGVNANRYVQLLGKLLSDGKMLPEDVDFVIGHGNGVPASDAVELTILKQFLGKKAQSTPLISVKPIYGHLLGGTGAINIAAAALVLQHGYVIPTLNIGSVSGMRRCTTGFYHASRAGIACCWGMGGHVTATLLRPCTP